jgi:hypothetical protein
VFVQKKKFLYVQRCQTECPVAESDIVVSLLEAVMQYVYQLKVSLSSMDRLHGVFFMVVFHTTNHIL